jgi:hypothetical protein
VTSGDRNARPIDGPDDWWADLDAAVLGCLAERGAMAPADLARSLGMSESGMVSLLWLLASQGRVRVCLVERTEVELGDRTRSAA